MTPRLDLSRLVGPLLTALVLIPQAGTAQGERATMSGRVIDRSSATAISRAEIVLLIGNRTVVSDSSGRYVFTALPAGVIHFLVRAPSFPTTRLIVELKEGDHLERLIELDSTAAGRGVQDLPAVAVTATAPSASYRLADFERRRRTGRGHYRTDEEIQQSGASSLQDAVRGMRGVSMECGAARGCRIHMVRAPRNCEPEYIVDARPNNDFGPSTPIRDIAALEVYTGPSDVPGEFAGRNSGCGVIVIWTRAGPPSRRD